MKRTVSNTAIATNINAEVGFLVADKARRAGITYQGLADALGVTADMLRRKMRGIAGWSITDVIMTASALGVPTTALIPSGDTVEAFTISGNSTGQRAQRDLNPQPSDP